MPSELCVRTMPLITGFSRAKGLRLIAHRVSRKLKRFHRIVLPENSLDPIIHTVFLLYSCIYLFLFIIHKRVRSNG